MNKSGGLNQNNIGLYQPTNNVNLSSNYNLVINGVNQANPNSRQANTSHGNRRAANALNQTQTSGQGNLSNKWSRLMYGIPDNNRNTQESVNRGHEFGSANFGRSHKTESQQRNQYLVQQSANKQQETVLKIRKYK